MRNVRSGRLTISITGTACGLQELRSHGGQLVCHPPLIVVIVAHVHSIILARGSAVQLPVQSQGTDLKGKKGLYLWRDFDNGEIWDNNARGRPALTGVESALC